MDTTWQKKKGRQKAGWASVVCKLSAGCRKWFTAFQLILWACVDGWDAFPEGSHVAGLTGCSQQFLGADRVPAPPCLQWHTGVSTAPVAWLNGVISQGPPAPITGTGICKALGGDSYNSSSQGSQTGRLSTRDFSFYRNGSRKKPSFSSSTEQLKLKSHLSCKWPPSVDFSLPHSVSLSSLKRNTYYLNLPEWFCCSARKDQSLEF